MMMESSEQIRKIKQWIEEKREKPKRYNIFEEARKKWREANDYG